MSNQIDQSKMIVNINSPQGEIYSHNSHRCRVHTVDGYLTIMPNHIPIVTALDIGAVVVTRLHSDEPDYIAIDGGVLIFEDNKLEIVASYAIRARDIDEARVKIEINSAEAEIQEAQTRKDTTAYQRARIRLNRAINQINVSQNR